jgi:hypothetical protein
MKPTMNKGIVVMGSVLCLGSVCILIVERRGNSAMLESIYTHQAETSAKLKALRQQLPRKDDAPASKADVCILSEIVALEAQNAQYEAGRQWLSAPRDEMLPGASLYLIMFFMLLSFQIEEIRKGARTIESSRPSTSPSG